METDVATVKKAMLGNWESIAPRVECCDGPERS
jgi:hypothetical protein